ncbi:tau 95 subunit of transcription factor TFIIIC [Chytridiales sp. JEL 0842]|nr:tau 95 subunit of transcription factor TFIIIC [Chytridiales sp. JEL 0842]
MAAFASDPEYEPAESFALPNWNFHCIEYPGNVQDAERAIETMGGQKEIERAFAEELRSIELRYRPEDPFSHPITGEVVETADLLLKVTRKRRKRPTGSNGTYCEDDYMMKTEVVGMVSKTCRFRALADFQYLVNPEDPMYKLRKALGTFDVQGIEEFEISEEKGIAEDLRSMPPPVFSRIEWSQDYKYKGLRTAEAGASQQGQGTTAPGVVQLKSVRISVMEFTKHKTTIPKEPNAAILAEGRNLNPADIAFFKTFFDPTTHPLGRHIWSRIAIDNTVPPRYRKNLRHLLPQVAYLMKWGPWRGCWVRYGYDPRTDIKSRFYQVVVMRFINAPKPLTRAKRLLKVGTAKELVERKFKGRKGPAEGAEEHGGEEEEGQRDDSHKFDGTLWRGAGTLQICDITDPEITWLIQGTRGVRKTVDEKSGWFDAQMIKNIREIVRNKIMLQSGRSGKEIRLQDFADVDEDEEVDEEEEGEGEKGVQEEGNVSEDRMDVDEGGEQGQVILEGLEDDIGKSIESKVDELMRNLQSANMDMIMGKPADYDEEDEFNYFDADDDEDEEDHGEVENMIGLEGNEEE